ncbi:MAG: SDR family oxidoreductase [Bacteroidota bacterium]
MFSNTLFQDQVALVTGGRSGIGYAIAKMMIASGAKVIISSRKAEPLAKAAEELGCDHMACDIRRSEQIQALASHIKDKYGRLDILINNAGGQFPVLAEMINDKGWTAVINNNLNGTFFMIREMGTHFFLPQKAGIVVNIIADIYAGFPGMVHTGAARAGVENLTKTLAVEWSEHQFRINCVAPGIIESSGLDNYPPPIQEMFNQARESIPAGRFGTVEEVANAVCFLASPLATYISGTTLYVDGAKHLHYESMGLPRVIKSFLG